jgi:hypothetical protein
MPMPAGRICWIIWLACYVVYDGWLAMLAVHAYAVYVGYLAMLSMLHGWLRWVI